MSEEKTFNFAFTVNDQFVAEEPEAAARYIEILKQEIATRSTAIGPRGGTYRLTTPPDIWKAEPNDPYWFGPPVVQRRRETLYRTRRQGRYVRPSRARLGPDTPTFATVTMRTRDGGVTLPNGSRVETTSPFVDVPVLSRS